MVLSMIAIRLGQVVRKLVNANPESQPLNVRGPKINCRRQPSKMQYFYRQPSNSNPILAIKYLGYP